MKPTVLVATGHPGGTNALIPVIKHLTNEGKVDLDVIAQGAAKTNLERAGIAFRELSEYHDIMLMRETHKKKPSLILTGQGIPDANTPYAIEQSAIHAADIFETPCISVSDFWSGRKQYYADPKTRRPFALVPDIITAIDTVQYALFEKEGFPMENIRITGSPAFDGHPELARKFSDKEHTTIKQQLGQGAEQVFLYSANAWEIDRPERGYADIDNIIIMNETLVDMGEKDTCVVIKMHPRVAQGDKQNIAEYVRGTKYLTLAQQRDPENMLTPTQYILGTDLTITPFSTMGIEALYLGRPAISMQSGLTGEDRYRFVTEPGIIPGATTKEECQELFAQMLAPQAREQTLTKAKHFQTDGKATERVVQLAYGLLELGE